MQKTYIEDIAYCPADEFISSESIETELSEVYDRLKLPYGRIEMQTGIKTRGVFKNKLPSDISTEAAKNLFKKSVIKPQDIDLVIHASVCRNFLEPSTASVVHYNLGLREDCRSFDLSNACLGVISAIDVARSMLQQKDVNKILIVTGENSWPLLSNTMKTILENKDLTRKTIKKYFANFTIGSAGVALVLNKTAGLATLGEVYSLSDTQAHTLCQGDGSTEALVMETNSEVLMQKGVALAKTAWSHFSQDKTDFDHILSHQVGIQHRNYLFEQLGLDLHKDYTTFDKYGNTGSAALPLGLALAYEEKRFNKNDRIALLGIGSGLHTTMMELKWN
ncbi:MAG: 3-oxoacyl-ACP synthase III [Halobacteriovoraceae bacterium]|nr:3-oxoacyl-ACP synthase III [Halobacteriovoraceae bacterium]